MRGETRKLFYISSNIVFILGILNDGDVRYPKKIGVCGRYFQWRLNTI